VKKRAAEEFGGYLERVQTMLPRSGYWYGERVSFHDAYALTLLRWGGFAGVDPKAVPGYYAYAQRVAQAPPVAAALARERISLDTFKG
jgi:glutathione S-transferase